MSEASPSPDSLDNRSRSCSSQGSEDRSWRNDSAEASPAGDALPKSVDDDLLDEALPVPQGDEAKAILEAILFSATSPLSEKRLGRLLNGVDPVTIRRLIDDLRRDYSGSGRGIIIMEVAGGYQLATRPECKEWVFRLHRHRQRSALTPAVLETLAIIAYKQPIVRADVEAIRGVDCGGILRQLQDAGLVEIVGRKEVAGRPPLYGTTDLFLKAFGLRRLSDLPSLDELQALLAESVEESDKEASAVRRPVAEAATIGEPPAPPEIAPRESRGMHRGARAPDVP